MAEDKKINFFEKFYTKSENTYNSICNWFTKKGINLNKLNDTLENKGIPSFPVVVSTLIVLLVIIIFLILFILNNGVELTINTSDYQGRVIDNVHLNIIDSLNEKDIYSGVINNSQKLSVPLSIGKEYVFEAKVSGYKDYTKNIVIKNKVDEVNITFEEKYSEGYLIINLLDFDSKKKITSSKAQISFFADGTQKELTFESDSESKIQALVPIDKELNITLISDGYESKNLVYTLTNESENITQYLTVNTLSFQGENSKVNITVVDSDDNPISQAMVSIYNNSSELLGLEQSDDFGKALFDIETGQDIRITVSKDDFSSFDSDTTQDSYRILLAEHNYKITLNAGGSSIKVNVRDKSSNLPIEESIVNIYNSKNNVVDTNNTTQSGSVVFKGLNEDENYTLTVCKSEYLCKQTSVNLFEKNEYDIDLEKLNIENSSKLSIWVYNSFNEPIDKANILIYKMEGNKEIPTGIGPLEVDISGYAFCNVALNETYKIVALVGDINGQETITMNSFSDNKVIIIIDDFSKIIKLNLLDENGDELTSGHILVKSKLGDILYDGNLDGTTPEFYSEGYTDFIVDYTSEDGDTTTFTGKAGEDDILVLNKQNVDNFDGTYPIIDFVSVEDNLGQRTNFITPNKDYYLVFNVVFPSSATSGGVHIRAGLDSEKDSENMSYGINGFSSDSTSFRYSTTYNALPAPGMSSIDYLNLGSSEELNKWLELEWKKDSGNIGEKQIKIKVRSIDSIQNKLSFSYRVWSNEGGNVYRDPKDSLLLDNINSNERQALYAETKNILVDLFEVPADCENDFCVAYKFVDKDTFDYTTNEFYAIKDNLYALEATLFSFKNKEVKLEASTSKTSPIISFIQINDKLQYPTNFNLETISELDVSNESINLTAGLKKKYYIFFVAKQLGNTYISTKISGNTISTMEDKFNFKIMPEKKMDVTLKPEFVISFDSDLIINIKDQETNEPIENAFIEISNEYNQFISSIKGNSLNGKGGTYIINQNFNSNKLKLNINAYGYEKVTKELIVADTGLIVSDQSVNINIGENQVESYKDILLRNTSSQNITNLRYEIQYTKPVNTLNVYPEMGIELLGNGSTSIKLYASVDKSVNFTSANAILTIYGLIGNTQVAKSIDVIITRGRVVEDCLVVTPQNLDFFVGEVENSENTNSVYFENKCSLPIYVTPELIKNKIGQEDSLDIYLPEFNINVGETKEYSITIKNLKNRKSTKSYNYELSWNNPNYIFENNKLNISFFNMDKVLQITPGQLFVPLSQTMPQNPAITYSSFNVKNTGNVPIRDISISNFTQKLSSNMAIDIQPVSKEILKPGESVNVTIKYSIKLGNAAIDDVKYLVKGYAPGSNTLVETSVSGIFLMSGAKCLKVLPKTLTYDLVVGEDKEKRITVTNTCAEAVQVLGFDKAGAQYIQTFGNNPIDFYPASNMSVIPQGASASFILKIKGQEYYESLKTPLQIYATTQSGVAVDSESILFSISITDEDDAVNQDYLQVSDSYIPVCGSENDEEINVKFPILTSDCLSDGFCQAYDAGKLLLKKINELQTNIISASAQVDNKVDSTECDTRVTNKNYCEISEVSSSIKPIEFNLYLQNDTVSVELLNELLRLDSASKNPSYKNINNFMVEVNTGSQSMGGISFSGNKIRLASNLSGCGKYHVTIDGAIAANYDQLMPKRAYYTIDIEGPTQVSSCTKNIENFLLFLPLDKELNGSRPLNTWLTKFTGNNELGVKLAENVFNNKSRFAKALSEQSKSNSLNINVGKITEHKDALAKIYFKDPLTSSRPKIEEIKLIINEDFKVDDELTEPFIDKSTKIVSNILNKNEFADICISKDKDYLLVLSLLDLGSLNFELKDKNPKVEVKEKEFCKDFIIKSTISENIKLSNTTLENVEVKYKVDDEAFTKKPSFALVADEAKDIKVCFYPKENLINTLVGEKIKITATSMYREKGKMGQREISRELEFTSCAITPVEFLSKINSKAQGFAKNEKSESESYVALIDWTKSYNSQEKEDFCKTLEKFNDANPNTELFYTQITSCDIKNTEAFGKAKTSRALEQTSAYFGVCFGTCGLCNGAGNMIFNAIPILGTAHFLKDLFLDCGLGCGIPSLVHFSTYADLDYIDNSDSLVDTIFLKPLSWLGSFSKYIGNKISEWISVGLGSALAGLHSGKRMIRDIDLTTMPGMTDDIKTVTEINPVPPTPPTPPTPPIPPTPPGPVNPSVRAISVSKNRIANYEQYFLGNSKTFDFVPNNSVDPNVVNDLKLKISSQGGISKLSGPDRLKFADVLEGGTFKYKGTRKLSASFYPSQGSFTQALRNSVDEVPITSVNSGAIANTSTSNVSDVAGTSQVTESITKLDDVSKAAIIDDISKAKNLSNELGKEMDSLNKKVNLLTGKQTKKNLARIEEIKIQKAGVDEYIKQGDEFLKHADNISDDAIRSYKQSLNKVKVKQHVGANFAAGFAKGLVCGVAGNVAGMAAVKRLDKGALKDSLTVNTDNVKFFEKNQLYSVTIKRKDDAENKFDLILTKSIPKSEYNRLDSCLVEEE